MDTRHEDLARAIAGELIQLPMVEAVCLGGSRGGTGSMADASSDIDLEVYTRGDVPLGARAAIMEATGGATRCDLGLPYWGPGDAWLAAGSDIEVDLVFFDGAWMEDQVARVLVRHEPALGYSTCFWHTVRNSLPLEDPRGWFAALQARARVAYPEALRSNIVAFNRPALRGVIPAYATQIARAAERGDLVSVNHRLAAFLASYFDIVFAVNRVPHPGEKRMLEWCAASCDRLPVGMAADVGELLRWATTDLPGLSGRIDRIIERLDDLLAGEGFPRATARER